MLTFSTVHKTILGNVYHDLISLFMCVYVSACCLCSSVVKSLQGKLFQNTCIKKHTVNSHHFGVDLTVE